MHDYIINEETYNKLSNNPIKRIEDSVIKEGDRIFIPYSCSELNSFFVDEYLEDNYKDVKTVKTLESCNLIVINPDTFHFSSNVGYEYKGEVFADRSQWLLYIDRIRTTYINTFKAKEKDSDLLKNAYDDSTKEFNIGIKETDANEVYYVRLYDPDFDVELFTDYIEGSQRVIKQETLLNLINKNIQDNLTTEFSMDDLIQFLHSNNKSDVDVAIKKLEDNFSSEDIIINILPFYYSFGITELTRVKLYDLLNKQNKIISKHKLLIDPNKANFNNYKNVIDSIKYLEKKLKIKLNRDNLIKSFMNEI